MITGIVQDLSLGQQCKSDQNVLKQYYLYPHTMQYRNNRQFIAEKGTKLRTLIGH